MTSYLSNKLRVLSFVLICMVVILHAQILDYTPQGIAVFVQKLITGRVTTVAVPFFFLISGFLLAYNLKDRDIRVAFRNKLSKKVRTLVIPYLVWSGLCITLMVMVELVAPSLFNGKSSISLSADYLVQELILSPTIAYQLWFVRDLIIVSFGSPLIYLILRYTRWLLPIVMIIVSLFFWQIWVVSIESITYFTLGMYIGIYKKNWSEYVFNNVRWWTIPCVWIAWCLLMTAMGMHTYLVSFVTKMLGIVSLWITFDLLYDRVIARWISLDVFSFSFFIFLFHEPLMTFVKQGYIRVIGVGSAFSALFFYLFTPIALISVIIIIGRTMRIHWRWGYNLLTGGR